MYTGRWTWSRKIQDFNSILALRRLSVQLGIQDLEREIEKELTSFLQNKSGWLNKDNVCCIFEQARKFETEEVEEKALDFICEYNKSAINYIWIKN